MAAPIARQFPKLPGAPHDLHLVSRLQVATPHEDTSRRWDSAGAARRCGNLRQRCRGEPDRPARRSLAAWSMEMRLSLKALQFVIDALEHYQEFQDERLQQDGLSEDDVSDLVNDRLYVEAI